MGDPAAEAVRRVLGIALSEELALAVGVHEAARFAERVQGSLSRLEAAVHRAPFDSDAWQQRAQAARDVAVRSICLAAAVESYEDVAAGMEAPGDQGWDWEFGVVVAEAIANSVTAVACTLGEATDPAACVGILEEVARELDCLGAYIFGGLCRMDAHLGDAQRTAPPAWACGREARLHRALSATCTWTLAALGRTAGGAQWLSAQALWEFASSDAHWALLLTKGLLDWPVDGGRAPAPPAPEELLRLRAQVLASALGLGAPSIAFTECAAEGADQDVSISERNLELAQHRARLASAVCDCRLARPLVSACLEHGAGLALAAFLAALLQPGAVQVDAGPSPSPSAEEVLAEAQAATASLCRCLEPHRVEIWAAFAAAQAGSAGGGRVPPGFAQDCARVAQLLPPPGTQPAAPPAPGCFGSPLAEPLPPGEPGAAAAPPPPARPGAPREAPPPGRPLLAALVREAPAELRCAGDGALMMDPVRTPQGLVFERATLLRSLHEGGGRCPVTGAPLELEHCARAHGLRREITAWVRGQRSPPVAAAAARG